MRDTSESEANELLSKQSVCDCSDEAWKPKAVQPDTLAITIGVTDEHGVGRQLLVELVYRRSHKTGLTRYKFSVFKQNVYGLQRVYQLEVVQSRFPIKDMHRRSHQHVGSTRQSGHPEWDEWDYDNVLQHFCTMTNVFFIEAPPHPEHFVLRGNK